MKRLFVLSAVLMTAAITLTSCWKTESQPEQETDNTEQPADSLPQPEVDSTKTVTPDTLTIKNNHLN